jgi:SAM-dependent methyltransferase
LKPSLVRLLRSPLDGSPLALDVKEQTDDEVRLGQLIDRSGNRFPISDGVPMFAQEMSQDETFSFKWRVIGDSYGHEKRSRLARQNWYLERFGFDTRDNLLDFLRTKAMILDVGTGSGVDAAMFAESGATVIAVDLCREAALATYRHLGHLTNVHVIQGDLLRLPFPCGLFHYVSCDQVIHHTPDPARSFAVLVRHLAQGGYMAIYAYRRKGPIREFVDDYLRSHTTEMGTQECYEFCQTITLLGKALSDLKVQVVIPEDIPLLDITIGSQDVQRFFYWNVMKCFWNDDFDFTTNTIVNFDWYHPKYASRHSPEEVRGWFEKHALEIVRFKVIPSGIAILGKLPTVHSEKLPEAG